MGKTRSKVYLGAFLLHPDSALQYMYTLLQILQVIDVPYMSQRKYVVREERERERQRGGGLAYLD